MKRILALLLVCALVLSACSTGKNSGKHNGTPAANSPAGVVSGTSSKAKAALNASSPSTQNKAHDDYPYNINADKKNFDYNKVKIIVGDNLYMTQINDWYTNFKDYENKSVEIEGYYIKYDQYTFVGRRGPTCPYCTGGYVDFEFQTNEDLSRLVTGKSWIAVTGILRKGTMYPADKEPSQPFYYIEALKIKKRSKIGKDTITN